MEPDRWIRISGLLDAALDQPQSERRSYVERECAGDETLLAEVVRLAAELERAGDFLEHPLFVLRQTFAIGDLVAGRYRIEALIGRGGMGEVYRAHDELGGERVALKTLRHDVGDDGDFLRRFRREVQVARMIAHPGVCRVFEIGVHGDAGSRQVHFFTMQYLDGDTLAARLRATGPLSVEIALPIASQVAAALDAAHTAGIMHRDLKSANVMLCGERAVIMDFGLARPAPGRADAGGTITVDAQVAGTIAYMSPEQLSGGIVTTATDVYSLGVVLFEMVTGRLPFNDRHIIRSAMQRASDGAPYVRAMAPELDRQWAAVIARALRRDPAQRYSSASAMTADLRPRWRPPTAYWSRREWLKAGIAAAATAGGVALLPIAFRFYSQDTVLPPGAEVLLGPIANLTGDERLDAVGELFRNQLSQSVHVNVLEGSRIADVLRQMGLAEGAGMEPTAVREAAWRLNAALSVYGTVARLGSDYVLSMQLETRGAQPDRPRAKVLRSFPSSDPAGLMSSVRDATIWVRQAIGESAASIAAFDLLPSDATTPSWRALAHYARGQLLFMRQEFNAAIDKFSEALAEDPKFTLAALRRADLLVTQNRQTEGFALYKTALALLEERVVTRPEELYGRGMFAQDSGDLEAADRYFRTWSTEYPFDWRAPFYRMLPLCMNGHAAQALELLEKLRPRTPDYGDLYAQLVRVHVMLGQTEEARALLPQIRRLNRPERADLHEAHICFREADLVACLEVLRRVQRSSYRRGAADAMMQEGLLLIDAGCFEHAAQNVDVFLRAGSWTDSKPQQIALLVIQAWAEAAAGGRDAAIEHARQALEAETGPLVVALAGTVFARAHARDLAESAMRLASQLDDLPVYQMARHRIAGEVAKAEGDTERALEELRIVAALEPPIAHRQYLINALPLGSSDRLGLSLNAVRAPWQNLRPPAMHHIDAMRLAVADVNSAGVNDPFAIKFAASSKKLESVL